MASADCADLTYYLLVGGRNGGPGASSTLKGVMTGTGGLLVAPCTLGGYSIPEGSEYRSGVLDIGISKPDP